MFRVLIAVIIASGVFPTIGFTAEIDGNAVGDTIRVPIDYPSIGLALANADSGYVVYVTGGPYYEWNLSMPPGVKLYSPTHSGVTINALQQGRHFGQYGDNAVYDILHGLLPWSPPYEDGQLMALAAKVR